MATNVTQQFTARLEKGTPIPGPPGPPGEQGPPGDPGTGINIQGSVPTAADLPATAALGQGWITEDTGHMWVWTVTGWVDVGPVQGPQGEPGITQPFQLGHTWALIGDISAITSLPSMFIPKLGTQLVKLVSLRARIDSGISIGVQIKRNGTNLGGLITVTTISSTTLFGNLALADGDELTLTLSLPVGSPTNLGMTLILEHTPA